MESNEINEEHLVSILTSFAGACTYYNPIEQVRECFLSVSQDDALWERMAQMVELSSLVAEGVPPLTEAN